MPLPRDLPPAPAPALDVLSGSVAVSRQPADLQAISRLLFLSAGNIHRAYGTKITTDVQGVLRRLPLSGWLFLLGFLAITGSPPFAPFVSEFSLLSAAFRQGQWVAGGLFTFLLLVIFFAFGAIVTSMVFGRPSPDASTTHYQDSFATTWPMRGGSWRMRTGRLGKVHTVKAHIAPWDDAYMRRDHLPGQPEPGKEEVDWDLWLGPCPKRPYNVAYIKGGWRGHYDFHTSCIGEWGAHTFAQCQVALGLANTSPVSYGFVKNRTGDGMVTRFCDQFSTNRDVLRKMLDVENGIANIEKAHQVPWPKLGETFLEFKLESILGTGAAARVYLAQQTTLGNRHVALKVTPFGSSEAQTLGNAAITMAADAPERQATLRRFQEIVNQDIGLVPSLTNWTTSRCGSMCRAMSIIPM